jgi:hypothetical protein
VSSRGLALNALRESASAERVLAEYYATCSEEQVASAYAAVARGLAVLEVTPRGELGPALRLHLKVLAAEQQRRKEGQGA